ncbi:MAG: aldo/keto reductase [Rhodoglobus sp.]
MTRGAEVAIATNGVEVQSTAPVGVQRTGPIMRQTGAISAVKPIRRTIGTSDLSVFPLAMSGNVFGWTADDSTTNRILDAYASHGGNFIDTADSYAAGRSETMIGNWMRSRRNRSQMTIATKVGKNADNPGLKARVLTKAVDESLVRLGTDHIDLLYLHIDDEDVAFEETLLAVDELIRAGKVRYFGASDHTGNRLIEARIASAQLGVAQMVALQNQYSLLHRTSFEGDLARVAAQQGLGVMPRFALASGFLSGKYRHRSDLAKHARGSEASKHLSRRGLRVLACLDSVAEAHDTSVASVALAWLLTKPNVVAPVVSASRPEQVADLATAPRLVLTRHQVADLDRASA